MPAARTTIWLYRLPSLLGAILTVLFTYAAAVALSTRRAAFVAALLMASVILLGVEARLAKTDAVRRRHGGDRHGGAGARLHEPGRPALAPLLGLASRRSGSPSASASWSRGRSRRPWSRLAALTLAVADRSRRLAEAAAAAGPASPSCSLIVLPWFVAITLKSGGAFFQEAVGQDMLAKVGGGQESHGAPPGTYLRGLLRHRLAAGALLLLALPFAVAGAALADRAVRAGLGGADVDRLRARAHEAAPLRAAALPGAGHPHRHRGRGRAPRPARLGPKVVTGAAALGGGLRCPAPWPSVLPV